MFLVMFQPQSMLFSGIALISGFLLLRTYLSLKRQKADEKTTLVNRGKSRTSAFQKTSGLVIPPSLSKDPILCSDEKPSPASSANPGKEEETTTSRKTEELDKIIRRRANTSADMTLERQRLSEQWDVEMLTLAREVKAEIDTKIVALQWMIADAHQVMAEMERKISSVTQNLPNETSHRLSPHILADSPVVDLNHIRNSDTCNNDIRNPNRETTLTSNATSDIENIQNMIVPDPFADTDFGLTKAIRELDRISAKIPPFEMMQTQTLGCHESRQVYENQHICPVSDAGSSVGSSSLELLPLPPMMPSSMTPPPMTPPPMTLPPMTRTSPVPVSYPIAPPLNTPVYTPASTPSSQYGAIPTGDKDADKDMDGYATTIRFPGSTSQEETGAVGDVPSSAPSWNPDRLREHPSREHRDHSQKQVSDRTPTDQDHDRDMIIRGLFPERRTINISHVGGPKLSPSSKILAQPAPKFESLTIADKENVKRMGSISTRPSEEEKTGKNNDVNLTADIPHHRKPNAKSLLAESEPYLRREVPELGVRTAKRHQVFYLSEQGISSREIAARIEMPVGEVELILSLYKRMSDDRQKKQQFPGKKNTKPNEPMKLTGRVIGGRKAGHPEKHPENNADHEKGS